MLQMWTLHQQGGKHGGPCVEEAHRFPDVDEVLLGDVAVAGHLEANKLGHDHHVGALSVADLPDGRPHQSELVAALRERKGNSQQLVTRYGAPMGPPGASKTALCFALRWPAEDSTNHPRK